MARNRRTVQEAPPGDTSLGPKIEALHQTRGTLGPASGRNWGMTRNLRWLRQTVGRTAPGVDMEITRRSIYVVAEIRHTTFLDGHYCLDLEIGQDQPEINRRTLSRRPALPRPFRRSERNPKASSIGQSSTRYRYTFPLAPSAGTCTTRECKYVTRFPLVFPIPDDRTPVPRNDVINGRGYFSPERRR